MTYYIALKASDRSAQVLHKSTGVPNMDRRNFPKKAGRSMATISLTPPARVVPFHRGQIRRNAALDQSDRANSPTSARELKASAGRVPTGSIGRRFANTAAALFSSAPFSSSSGGTTKPAAGLCSGEPF